MGLQISHRLYTKREEKSLVRETAQNTRNGFPRTCTAKRERDSGGSCNARPRAHADLHTAQVRRRVRDRVPEGQKSAIAIARMQGKERNYAGEHFWARGYAVSTAGFEVEQVREYIKNQEESREGSF